MKKHPEYMILIAVVVALFLGIICFVTNCSALIATSVEAASGSTTQILEGILDDGTGNSGDGAQGSTGGGYSDSDVPSSMEIETDELTNDLQSCINQDIVGKLNLSESDDITITNLTKDKVGTPELKNGYVLCQVSGTATVTNVLGKESTIEYTSYYYAEDPTASTITWYIYAYDLSDYSNLPQGLRMSRATRSACAITCRMAIRPRSRASPTRAPAAARAATRLTTRRPRQRKPHEEPSGKRARTVPLLHPRRAGERDARYAV